MQQTSYLPVGVGGSLAGLAMRSSWAPTSFASNTSSFLQVDSFAMMIITTFSITLESSLSQTDVLFPSFTNITQNNPSFILKGHPINSPTFFMLAIKRPLEIRPLTPFNKISFHHKFYIDDNPEEFDPTS